MSESLKDKKERVLVAAEKAVDELIKVLEEKIITNTEEDLTADKMKNAAQAKKLAFLDALEMLEKVGQEREKVENIDIEIPDTTHGGFAEVAVKSKKK